MVLHLNFFQNPLINYPVLETTRHNNPSHCMKQGMVLKQNKFESESRTKTFLSTSFFLYFSCTQCQLMFGFRTSFIINKVEKNLDRLLVSLSARTVSNEQNSFTLNYDSDLIFDLIIIFEQTDRMFIVHAYHVIKV